MAHKISTLDNGLRVLFDFMPDIESVSIRILFKVGSRHERNSIEGISHILEHMCFKGTEKRSAKEIAESFDKVGGYINAFTGKENTVYHAKVLSGDIETALDVLSDILLHSKYDKDELQKELGVIKQEISEGNDDPESLLFDKLYEAAFPDHQIGKPIGGSHDSVDTCTQTDLQKYVAQHYTPNNAIIGIAGNINEDTVMQILNEKFGQWSTSSTQNDKSIPQYQNGNIRVTKPIEQAHFVLAFPGVSVNDDKHYIYDITSIIAGGSMSSRLFQKIREQQGLAYSVSAFSINYSDCGLWGVHGIANSQGLNNMVKSMIEELKAMRNDIRQDELKSAKAQIKASILMSMESSGYRADKMVHHYSSFGKVLSNDEIISKIDAVTINDVEECIKFILQSQCCISAVGNIGELISYDEIAKLISDV